MRYLVKRMRFATPLLGGRPAITYATYRTASTSIHHAIRRAGLGVSTKAHMLAPDNMVDRVRDRHSFADATANLPRSCHVGDWAVRLGVIEPRREADFVISIRDPWAIAHSIFVLTAAHLDPELHASAPQADGARRAQLVDRAESIIFGAFPRELMSRWIRFDAAPALGWDPLGHAFDRERGADSYEHGPWRILIIRADIDDGRKSAALRAFFKRPSITVEPKNEALSKRHTSTALADIARAAIARRPDEVRALLDDPVARHFWTAEDLERMRAKWTRTR